MLWVLLLLFYYASRGCCNDTRLYVYPEKDQCRHIELPCDILDNYAIFANKTTSNTELIFADGNYSLHKNISFIGLSRITLRLCRKCQKSIINCMHGAGFKFQYIEGLKIDGLTFHRCSRVHSDSEFDLDYNLHAALYLHSVSNLTMSGITIEHSIGYGIYMYMLNGHARISKCSFQFNIDFESFMGGNAILHYEGCKDIDNFGKIGIEDSLFQFGKSSHHYTSSGLAILLQCSGIKVMVKNTRFEGNEAKISIHKKDDLDLNGGNLAIAFYNTSTHNSVDVENCTFASGQAFFGAGIHLTYSGISLHACENTVTVIDSVFFNNSAFSGGGAIYVKLYQGVSVGNSSCIEKGETSIQELQI